MQAKIYSETFLGPSELLGVYKQQLTLLPIDTCKKITWEKWKAQEYILVGAFNNLKD